MKTEIMETNTMNKLEGVKHFKGYVKIGGLKVLAVKDVSADGTWVVRTEAGTMYTGINEVRK